MTTIPPISDPFGPVAGLPLSRIQQAVGRRLQAAWSQIPHVTHHEEADVTAIDALRRQRIRQGAHALGLLPYVARACVLALREYPTFCASLDPDGKTLWLKHYVHLGIAVDAAQGLLVAVATQVADAGVAELDRIFKELAAKARAGTLRPTDMEGSCFTISSLGKLGGLGFTPIINPPNVAILGTGEARLNPRCIDGGVVPRLILPLSLSFDHRVINGAEAGRFCGFIRDVLARPEELERA